MARSAAPNLRLDDAVTVLEIRFGLQLLPAGKRRNAMSAAFDRLLTEAIQQRVSPFDAAAAEHAAALMADRQRSGSPGDLRDAMIAGIALCTHASIATRNLRHFRDLACPLIDPWTA